MNGPDERDPLSNLLSSVALPPSDSVRREAIFARTRGILWRRRFVRRSGWAVTLIACYAVGALSVLAWQSAWPHNVPGDRLPLQAGGAIEIANPGSNPASTKEPKPGRPRQEPHRGAPSRLPGAPQNAIARADAPSLTAFEKLRRAGDRQLNERGNLRGAIGCYRRALDFASDDDLQIVPERDSWLLIPLKEARLEARKHVHKKS